MSRDFRYVMADGTEIEAFQMHEGSRYQEGGWPEWMDSKMLMTKVNNEGQSTHWLNIADVETEIPPFGWIVKHPSGTIGVLDYETMEAASKVVRDVPKVPDISKPQPDSALRLAVKLTKRPFDELKALDLQQVEEANRQRQHIIDSMHPDDAAAGGYKQTGSPEIAQVEVPVEAEPATAADEMAEAVRNTDLYLSDSGPTDIILELCDAYEDLADGKVDEARVKFRNILSQRVAWCQCPPGQCAGLDPLICRTNSPLTR